ncbi:hypothetical protein N7447_004421 [Penicillium robsamsonii]|uniref:uncharacterized protein n=1 Tax=Penicillium robsamsonii TaxID=1792511 RepID=UPI002546A160|nr:uncharacterized protein N7447_004421 [Penicillium robsamsonii]KAJ5827658.1 hypothetical protein N7447_004421 [Penicillium robsamsonii]
MEVTAKPYTLKVLDAKKPSRFQTWHNSIEGFSEQKRLDGMDGSMGSRWNESRTTCQLVPYQSRNNIIEE